MKVSLRPFLSLSIIVAATFCVLHSDISFAWGNLGHRITGLVAEELLTPLAKHNVESLLGDETLADAATYMDTHRDEMRERWPESAKWHYDNREVCGDTLNCRDGNCATQQIEHFLRVLADKNSPRQQRALALRLIVHMIGDIHQPLHMADNHDRGGNDVWVRMYAGAERKRLHEIFDTALLWDNLDHQRDTYYAHELLSRYRTQIKTWQEGDVTHWADESYQLGSSMVYASLPGFSCRKDEVHTITLPSTYALRAHQVVDIQLVKAGIRIATVLNTTLQ
jgi:hypothetical protein